MEFKGYRGWTIRGLEGDTWLEPAYYVCPDCEGQTGFPLDGVGQRTTLKPCWLASANSTADGILGLGSKSISRDLKVTHAFE